jgi:hypothetical protein
VNLALYDRTNRFLDVLLRDDIVEEPQRQEPTLF